MNKYLELFRFENGLIGIIGIVVAAFIASGMHIGDYWQSILVSCVVVIFFIAGGNTINDYVDRDIDKISHPNRPIPSGRIEPKNALYIGIGSMICAGLFSILLFNLIAIAIGIIAIVLMLSYELFLKQRGFIGNLTIAILTGMVFLLGGAIVGHIENSYEIAAMATIVSIGREITKDIEDMEGDKGRYTLPMAIGKKNSGIIAAIFYIAGPILSILPMIDHSFGPLYYTVLISDAMFIYAAYILFTNPHKSQKVAKVAMLAALIAFVLGAVVI